MLLIVFVAFAALLVAWLAAPNGEARTAPKTAAAPAPAPALTTSEAGV